MKYTHIVWDFNGTILDDVEIGIKSVNAMLEKRGLPTIRSTAQYRELFDFPVIEYYRRLGLDVEHGAYQAVLAPEWVAHYLRYEKDTHAVAGVQLLLRSFAAIGVPQTVLSASERELLCEQLRRLDLDSYFSEIYGLDNIHAYSKEALAQKWRREHAEAVVLCIGDTLHDAQIARSIHADCILYAGGHQSRKRLTAAGFPVASSMREIGEMLGLCGQDT